MRATEWLGFPAEYWIYDNRVSDQRRRELPSASDSNQHLLGLIGRPDLSPFTIDVGAVIPRMTDGELELQGLPWLEISLDFGRRTAAP